MKKMASLVIIGILCLSMFSIFAPRVKAETGSWTTKSSLPQPMAVQGVAAANGEVYAIGGQYLSGGSFVWSNTNYEYDPVNDNWVSKASMPTTRAALAVVTVNDKVYAIGGAASASGGAFSTNEEYDPSSNSWTTMAPMPTPRNWISAVAVNDKIYVMDGSDNSGGIFSMNEVYDTVADTWTTKTPDPQARVACGIGAVNGKIYLIGGWVRPGAPPGEPTTLNEEYDPQTDTWTTKAPMPTARNGLAVAVMNNKIYAIGGATDFNPWTNNLNVVEEYDPSTDTWTTVQSMPTPRSLLGADVVGDKIFAVGGWGSAGYLDTNEVLSIGALVGYWKFDEGSGSIAHDSSGNGNDGTVVGAGWTNGVFSGALQFDGIDDYVGVSSLPSICVTGNQISVQLWMKPAVTLDANTPITNILDKGDEYGFQMDQYSSGRIWFFVWLNGAPWQGIQTTTSLWQADTWYLLTGTYDGSNLKVYVNGFLENSRPLSNDLSTSGFPLAMGSYCLGSKNFFNGAIDEVKIYNCARSADQIAQDYQSFAGPIGYWKFDEGSGSVAHDSAGTNDGIIRGVPSWTTGIVGGALSFDGAQNDYVAMSSTLGVTDAMTVEVWVYPTFDPTNPAAYPQPFGDAARTIIRKSSCGDDTFELGFYSGYYFNPTNPVPYISAGFQYQGGGCASLEPVSIPGLISEGQWYHLVITFNRNDFARLYVNGVEKMAVPTEDQPLRVSSRHLTIGQEADTIGGDPLDTPSDPQTWIGKIDEAKIYNYTRTAEEISSDYSLLPEMFVNPSVSMVGLNMPFTVNINVKNVSDLYNWEAKIYYDKALLNYTGATEGGFLKSGGSTVWVDSSDPNFNDTHGMVYVGSSLLGRIPGVNGDGILATLGFQAFGNSTLTLSETLMLDSLLNDIPLAPVGGSVIVGNENVVVSAVGPDKRVVGQNLPMNITITVENLGESYQAFNVTLYLNSTAIGVQQIASLAPNGSLTFTYTWNASAFHLGNYVLNATASRVTFETNYDDNALVNGTLYVGIVGDISGKSGVPDGKVDMRDIGLVARAFSTQKDSPYYVPECDLNDDGIINMRDIGLAARHFGDHYP